MKLPFIGYGVVFFLALSNPVRADDLFCETMADEVLSIQGLGTFSAPEGEKISDVSKQYGNGFTFKMKNYAKGEGVVVYPKRRGKAFVELRYLESPKDKKPSWIRFEMDRKCKLASLENDQKLVVKKKMCEAISPRLSRDPASIFPLKALSLKSKKKKEKQALDDEWKSLKQAGFRGKRDDLFKLVELCVAYGELFPGHSKDVSLPAGPVVGP